MPVIVATVPAPPVEPPALIVQAPLPATASGVVVDARSGAPVGGALVQQADTVTSAFTKADGGFRMLLDPRGGRTLTISAVGYESRQVAVGQDLAVRLEPVESFLPAAPIAPVAPIGTSEAETSPLNTHVLFGYSVRHQVVTSGNASVSGFANNDFRLGARFRWYPWVAEALGAHFETPVDVAGLPREENPAFFPSTWQFGARLGRIFPLAADLETAAMLGYRYSNTSPNNQGIPYTGSNIDFEQSRHALGAVGTAAWRPGRGPWHYEAQLGLYPLVSAWADAPGQPFGGDFLADARVGVSYEIVRGMRLGLGAQHERWWGNGADASNLLTVNVHYTPGGVPTPGAAAAEAARKDLK